MNELDAKQWIDTYIHGTLVVGGSCNTINDPCTQVCVPIEVKNMNVKVFNLISAVNETNFKVFTHYFPTHYFPGNYILVIISCYFHWLVLLLQKRLD